jgi:hypothetical protein
MCAIVGSFDKDKLIELIKLNSYRGSHSFSVTMLDSIRIRVVEKAFGEVDIDKISNLTNQLSLLKPLSIRTEFEMANAYNVGDNNFEFKIKLSKI